jgi:SAM-dependent methyltransferase
MSVFSTAYAGSYDSFYRDKDYEAECAFLGDTFARFRSDPVESILDLGCGTGGHAIPLARDGWNITGVDRSPQMVEIAQAKAKAAGVEDRVRFLTGDLQTFEAGSTFDVVICLFAVFSYLTKLEDLVASFRNVRRHLKPGGLFIFDLWYGPAVLADPPADRFKIIDEADRRIIRLSHPVLSEPESVVTIAYHLFEIRGREVIAEDRETHTIRYFFSSEIEHALTQAGFIQRALHPSFKPGTPITLNDWVVMAVASPTEEITRR